MSWQPPPLHRHLSTIGIGPVFFRPPPHTLLPEPFEDEDPTTTKDGDDDSNIACVDAAPTPPPVPSNRSENEATIDTTWEIVGDIKTTPEDFIVREISWAPPSSQPRLDKDGVETNDKEILPSESEDIKHHNPNKCRRRPTGWTRRIAGMEERQFQRGEILDGKDSMTGDASHDVGETHPKDISSRAKNIVANNKDLPQALQFSSSSSTTEKGRKEQIIADDRPILDGHDDESSSSQPPSKLQKTVQPPSPQSKQPSSASNNNDQRNEDLDDSVDSSPMVGLRRILMQCCHPSKDQNIMNDGLLEDEQSLHQDRDTAEAVDAILQQLSDLQNSAREGIVDSASSQGGGHSKSDGNYASESKPVWIPTARLFQNPPELHTNNGKEDWRLLHQYVRRAFPLLRTEASSVGASNKRSGDDIASDPKHGNEEADGSKQDGDSINNKSWVYTLVDDTFFHLAPCLANPSEDLLLLYRFRNDGPIPASSEEGNGKRARHDRCNGGKKIKRKFRQEQGPQKEHQQTGEEEDKDTAHTKTRNDPTPRGIVLLRLRPDLPRSERRAIHQTLSSSRRREFETSTINDVALNPADKDSNRTTVAIAVQWSRNAINASRKKRKRTDNEVANGNSNPASSERRRYSDITAIFCVLRKYQCEHQVAVNQIVRALKCRMGDVGLAGIKDTQAVTYQFCTLRNVGLKRARANSTLLGNRIRLSNFVEVRGSNSLLNCGELLGNRFEITQRLHEGQQSWKEKVVPVHSSHLDAMVKRIGDSGFVNFYGEQRVGNAGCRSRVGVRSFDVGKAMLQHNFPEAIDLIMAGRSSQVYSPGAEEVDAREVWMKTGDARATLSRFPKNRNIMVRERDLMKGMLRYGDALEAIRCVPYSTRMFWIHAYQSFVWNRVATERVKRWGLCPIVGDLYLASGSGGKDGTTIGVQVVSDPGSVDISQIVLPLPGYNVQYPSHEIGEMYRKILNDDGVELSKGTVSEATAKGSYRKLIQRADQLVWEIVPEKEKDEPEVSEDPIVSSAKLTFELESGCYATMVLRELMVATMARDCSMKQ